MRVFADERPTKDFVIKDKKSRHDIRQWARKTALQGTFEENMAARMAMNGYGVDDLIAQCNVPRSLAMKLVLGV